MQSIGERLEEARKKKGISIREAAEGTKIRGDYLQQFENNRFDINLTEIYVRGFLRAYATYLKLPADKILNDYASLGRGDVRPRQPSREVYGRMDVSVASAEDRKDADVEETPAAAPARRQPAVSRGSHASSGPSIDPALLFKLGKLAVGILVIVLVVWGIVSIFSGRGSSNASTASRNSASTTATTATTSTPAPAPERTITLVALDVVRVTVKHKNPDASEGDTIYQGTLTRGQTQTVPWTSPIYIIASAGENLQIEYRGRRFDSKFTGPGRAQMDK
jgi:cytoskeletal protein RodZ